MARARIPGATATILGLLLVVAACGSGPAPAPDLAHDPAPEPTAVSIEAARTELKDLISDVTAADAFRYRTADDVGRWMDTAKIIPIPETGEFAAVYHTWNDADQAFHVELATSGDLMHWTWRDELGSKASQPTIQRMSDGGYVVAWEQEPDPIHLVLESFDSWDDLRVGAFSRVMELPVTTPACGEGTPSIRSASSTLVEVGFHYHGGCVADREAEGTTDWDTWQATARNDIDDALMRAGARGHIGDRDEITFRGHELMLVDAQLVFEDFGSWRTFLYDEETGVAEQLAIRTHAGSLAFANPAIEQVEIGGKPALMMGFYLFTEGARGDEDGELTYYRTLPAD